MPAIFAKKVIVYILAELLADFIVRRLKDAKEKYDERREEDLRKEICKILDEWEILA